MKRGWMKIFLTAVLALVWLGCSSPMKEAQTMYDQGQYEQLIAKYNSNPEMASIVQMAKDKLVEKLFADGKYNTIVEMYPDSKMMKEARNKLAEQLLAEGKLDEVLSKYGDTPAAMQARLQREQMRSDSLAAAVEKAGKKVESAERKTGQLEREVEKKADETQAMTEKAAENEFKRIMSLANPTAKRKALESFLKKDEYKNTAAYSKAQAEFAKM